MPTRALTVAAVQRLKPPPRGQLDYFDKGFPGLALRISYGGSKTWVYFYRLHGGKLRRLTLGRWPAMELAEARAGWQQARKRVGKGESPAVRLPAAADSFAAAVDTWLKRDQASNRSYGEVKRVIERDVKPVFEGRLVATIDRTEIADLLDGIADRGAPVLARRVQAHLHRFFRWSVGRGYIAANPMADMEKVGTAVERDRVLTDAELAVVWNAVAWDPVSKAGWPFAPAIRLLILTGARREEMAALRWAEIVGDRIELAGARTKNEEPHHIPLVHSAADIIHTLPRVDGSEFVFTTTGKSPISGWSRAKKRLDSARLPFTHPAVTAVSQSPDCDRTIDRSGRLSPYARPSI
jgi:integrase